MNKSTASSLSDSAELAGVATLQRFRDFDNLASFYTGWNVQIEQASEGTFEGAVRLARTRSLYVVEGEFSQSIVVRGSSNPLESAFYLIEPASENSMWWGRRFQAGSIVSVGPSTPAEYSSARHTCTTGAAACTEALEQARRSVLGIDEPANQLGWSAVRSCPRAMAALAIRLRRLMSLGVADPALLDSFEGKQLEQECLRAIVIATHSDEHLRHNDLPVSSRSALVTRAEELMRSQLRQPLGSLDLCQRLGVSDRTLRQAFNERYQVGPMVYYKQLRLNAVHAQLKVSEPGTIGSVARRFGFHHLGNFSADFHRAFGCRPSDLVGEAV